jgi:hypothetical protein
MKLLVLKTEFGPNTDTTPITQDLHETHQIQNEVKLLRDEATRIWEEDLTLQVAEEA